MRATVGAGLISILAAAGAVGPGGEEAPLAPAPEARVHSDPAAIEQATLEATLGFLRADLAAARTAMDRIEKLCLRLEGDKGKGFASGVVTYDRAFHTTLDFAREFAGKGRLEDSFEQFVWIQRGCRGCHNVARDPVRGKAAAPGTAR